MILSALEIARMNVACVAVTDGETIGRLATIPSACFTRRQQATGLSGGRSPVE